MTLAEILLEVPNWPSIDVEWDPEEMGSIFVLARGGDRIEIGWNRYDVLREKRGKNLGYPGNGRICIKKGVAGEIEEIYTRYIRGYGHIHISCGNKEYTFDRPRPTK